MSQNEGISLARYFAKPSQLLALSMHNARSYDNCYK
jgi:hypothetical protein